MRVAVVLEQCWHRVPGGTARAAIQQVAAVAGLGTVDQVGVAARHRSEPDLPWRPPVTVRRLALPRRALYESWHRFRRPRVERATGPVDVIHATGYAVPPRSRPLVVTLHDLAWRRDPGNFTRHGVRFFEGNLRRVRQDADLVLCPSEATMADCEAAGIERDRLRHVPWGIAAPRAGDGAVADVRERYGLTGRYVLFVGTLEPRKNLPRLIEAVRRLPHDDVVLAVAGPVGWGDVLGEAGLDGDGDGEGRGESTGPGGRSAAGGAGAAGTSGGGRIRLLGFVDPADLAPLNRGAAVVCYPSLWEGYGLPVAEALAQGVPVVTSRGTATEELVAGGAGLTVDPHSSDEIASALTRVLDDPDLATQLGSAAEARAAERTWEATARLTAEAYEAVAG